LNKAGRYKNLMRQKPRCYVSCFEYKCKHCEIEELVEWMENHPDEVYSLTGVNSGIWIGTMITESYYNMEGYEFMLDDALHSYDDNYASMKLKEAMVYQRKLIDVMRKECKASKRGLKPVPNAIDKIDFDVDTSSDNAKKPQPTGDPDAPLYAFLNYARIKPILIIHTDILGKQHVLRAVREFIQDTQLQYVDFDASAAAIDNIHKQIEFLQTNAISYPETAECASQTRTMIVVEGLNQETDSKILQEFLKNAATPGQMLKGSAFVFITEGAFLQEALVFLNKGIGAKFASIYWPPRLDTDDRVIYETTIAAKDVKNLYNSTFIKWYDSSTSFLTSELIAEYLLIMDVDKEIRAISPIESENSGVLYKGDEKRKPGTRSRAEIVAKELYKYCKRGQQLGILGTVFDWKVPLKGAGSDESIPLVSFNPEMCQLWLLNIRNTRNKDTLLCCMLEISTYYQLLDKDRFIESYSMLQETNIKGIRKGILLFQGSSQTGQTVWMRLGAMPNLKEFAQALEVSILILKKDDTGYTIEEFDYNSSWQFEDLT